MGRRWVEGWVDFRGQGGDIDKTHVSAVECRKSGYVIERF